MKKGVSKVRNSFFIFKTHKDFFEYRTRNIEQGILKFDESSCMSYSKVFDNTSKFKIPCSLFDIQKRLVRLQLLRNRNITFLKYLKPPTTTHDIRSNIIHINSSIKFLSIHPTIPALFYIICII